MVLHVLSIDICYVILLLVCFLHSARLQMFELFIDLLILLPCLLQVCDQV